LIPPQIIDANPIEKNQIELHEIPTNATINGEGGAVIDGVGIFSADNQILTIIYKPGSIKVVFRVRTSIDISAPWVGFSFINSKGLRILGSNSYGLSQFLEPLQKGDCKYYSFTFDLPEIENGKYFLSVAINDGTPDDHRRIFNVLDALEFEFISNSAIQKQVAIFKITECALEESP
jgi:hypothetical protein